MRVGPENSKIFAKCKGHHILLELQIQKIACAALPELESEADYLKSKCVKVARKQRIAI